MDRCEECGYAYDLVAASQSGGGIRTGVAELAELLKTGGLPSSLRGYTGGGADGPR